jgi:hypothetical protein
MNQIPNDYFDHKEIVKMMKINAELIQEGISLHIDNELKRFKTEIEKIKNGTSTASRPAE